MKEKVSQKLRERIRERERERESVIDNFDTLNLKVVVHSKREDEEE